MPEQVTKEKVFKPGDKLWWKRPGGRVPATYVRQSASGQRIQIEYEYHSSWTGGVAGFKALTYVAPDNVESRA